MASILGLNQDSEEFDWKYSFKDELDCFDLIAVTLLDELLLTQE